MKKVATLFWKLLYHVFNQRFVLAKGAHWTVYRHGDAKLFHYDPGPASRTHRAKLLDRLKDLYQCIGADPKKKDSRSDNDPVITITAITIEQGTAAALWLTGKFTLEHLRSATEDQEFIRIPGVPFGSLTVDLILVRDISLRNRRVSDSRPTIRRVIRNASGPIAVLELGSVG